MAFMLAVMTSPEAAISLVHDTHNGVAANQQNRQARAQAAETGTDMREIPWAPFLV
jgi:hypothetical protein